MAESKIKNYERCREEILRLASRGAVCFSCPANTVCDALCSERGIDKSKQEAPCFDAMKKWADS